MADKIKNFGSMLLAVPHLERLYRKIENPSRRNGLVILAYHRVFNRLSNDYPFDEELISAYPEVFEQQMIFVKNNFNVTNFQRINDLLTHGKSIPSGSLIVTFDDGYEDNYSNAFKVIKKYGLTATMFISTGYIESDEIFWFEKVSYYLKKVDSGKLSIDSLNYNRHINKKNKNKIIVELLTVLKRVPNPVRLEAMNELNYRFNNLEITDRQFIKTLDWDQIIEMDQAGLEIGSHSVSHPILSAMKESEIRIEMLDSKKTLENKLGHKIISISYPDGERLSFNTTVERIAFESGYKFGFNYVEGVNSDLSNPYSLKRIRVERYMSFQRFSAQLFFPKLFFI